MIKWILIIAVIVALAVVWMLFRASRNEAKAEADTPPSGQFVEVGGTRVHLEISGSGPPIVMIHGASGNLRDLTFDLAPALGADFTTISVDRPGLGYTPALSRTGATIIEQADLLAAAVQKLGYDKVYLLGQSYGGSVALAWALEHPKMVAGIVLVSSPSNVWEGGLDPLYRINANPVFGPVLRLLVSAFPPEKVVQNSLEGIFSPQTIPDGYGEHVGLNLTLRRSTQRANALQVAALKDQIRDIVPRYGEISVPIEAIHGTADTIVPETIHTEKLAKQIKDIHVTILPGVGHMPHHTNIETVVSAINRLHDKVGLKPAQ